LSARALCVWIESIFSRGDLKELADFDSVDGVNRHAPQLMRPITVIVENQ